MMISTISTGESHKSYIVVIILWTIFFDSSAIEQDRTNDGMRTSQVCQARCLARCRDDGLPAFCTNDCEIFRNDEWIPKCISEMKKLNSTVVKKKGESAVCLLTCFNINNETGPVQDAPSIYDAGLSNDTLTMEWLTNEGEAPNTSAVFIVERRKQGTERWQPWAKTWQQNFTVEPTLSRDQVCTLYEYRVSAVNRYGRSPYSISIESTRDQLPKPDPVEGLRLLKSPYYDQKTTNIYSVITWRSPRDWAELAQFTQTPSYSKHCHLHNSVPAGPIFSYNRLLKQLEVRVHKSAFGCRFHVQINTPCSLNQDRSLNFVPQIRLYSPCQTPGEPKTIDINLEDCDKIKNFVCPSRRPRAPSHVRDISVKVIEGQKVHVTWSLPSDLGTTNHIVRYDVRWGQIDRSSLFPTLKKENATWVPQDTKEVQFEVNNTGVDYGVQIVAAGTEDEKLNWGLYPFTQFHVPLEVTSLPLLNNNTSGLLPKTLENRTGSGPFPPLSARTLWYILVPTIIVIFLMTLTFFVARRRRKFQHLNQSVLPTETFNLYNQMGDRDESPTSTPTHVADRWEIPYASIYFKHELGEGAFGHVFYASLTLEFAKERDDVMGLLTNENEEEVPVAVKRLHNFADKQQKQEFKREIQLMKTLGDHANVVSMIGCCTLSDPLCLVVEHMPNGDLLKYLRNHRHKVQNHDFASGDDEYYETQAKLTYTDLLNFARQIARGMEFLSQRGFVHRDLACRNLLVGENHTIKVGDFGLTRYVYDDRVYVNRKGGKLPLKWMSLEAIFDLSFTTLSDVWSFGIVLFEITTLGGTPYPGLHNKEFLHRIKSGYRMERPDGCDAELYQIMRRCWQERSTDRPDFTALCHELEKLIERHSNTDYLDIGPDVDQMYYNAPVLDDSDQDDISDIISLHDNQSLHSETESPIWRRRNDLQHSETRDSWNDPLNLARSSGSSGRASMGTKAASDDAFEDVYTPEFRRQDSGNVSYDQVDCPLGKTSSTTDLAWFDVTTV